MYILIWEDLGIQKVSEFSDELKKAYDNGDLQSVLKIRHNDVQELSNEWWIDIEEYSPTGSA